MSPLLLGALLLGLIVVPLVVIAVFALIGKIFSAPRRFGSILFIVLFLAVLGGAGYGYFRAGDVSGATVTNTSERIVVDDSLRAHHDFTATVDIPALGSRTIEVPARVHDQATIGEPLRVRAGTLLGIQLARAQTERIDELVPLGSLACGILVVLMTAIAASARRARAPVILVVIALLAGTMVQPAVQAVLPHGATQTATATVTGSSRAGVTGTPSVRALGYLRGPFSIDDRWMWLNDKPLRFVAVTFTPQEGTVPVTAADVVPAAAAPPVGQPVTIRYQPSDPRRITLPGSDSTLCGWIMIGVIAAIELLLLLMALLLWRWRRRSARRAAARERSLSSREPSLMDRLGGPVGGAGGGAAAPKPGVVYEPGFSSATDGAEPPRT